KKNKFFTHEHLASMINFHICEHDGLRDLKQSMTEQMSEILSEISQHCKIKTLMGHSKNAVRIQMITGIITYLLLRLTFEKVEIKISLINLKHKIKNQLFKLVTKM
uniref:hypothetical protein n=1 Tax=Cellulosilyticum ruminicola TaxID=425254 RepID=UPI0038BB88C6